MQVVVIHVLGDVPVVPLAGWLQDRPQNWRVTMSVGSTLLLAAALVFLACMRFSRGQPDYRQLLPTGTSSTDEEQAPVLPSERSA